MPTQLEVRDALRTLHGAAPEATALVEEQLDMLEQQITLHTSEDAFRAFVLSQAQQTGVIQALLQRLDTSVLAELVRADAARAETDRLAAAERAERAMTTKQVLSQPVVLGSVAILSTLMTGLVTLVLHLVGATG
jgi:hypothetical protein